MFSIIIPIYKVAEEYLSECLESVCGQDYEDKEIILVSDGASKDIVALCERFKERYSCVSLIRQQNKGVSAARNKALGVAKGDYVIFVDADDRMMQGILTKLADCLTVKGTDIVIYGYRIFGSKSQSYQGQNCIYEGEEKKSMIDWLLGIRENTSGIGVNEIWAKAYRRTLLQKKFVSFPESIAIGEDQIFNLYAFQSAETITCLKEMGYEYRWSEQSACHSTDINRLNQLQKYHNLKKQFIIGFYGRGELLKRYLSVQFQIVLIEMFAQYFFHPGNMKGKYSRYQKFIQLMESGFGQALLINADKKKLKINYRICYVLLKNKQYWLCWKMLSTYHKYFKRKRFLRNRRSE